MNSEIVLSAEQILRSDTVESSRLELKAHWDEVATGPQVIKTIAAFANDFQNQNGGYVVIGVAEEAGKAVLPSVGPGPIGILGAFNFGWAIRSQIERSPCAERVNFCRRRRNGFVRRWHPRKGLHDR